MDMSAIAALLGALIGAAAGVAGQLVAAAYASHSERRRLAIDAGFREWDAFRQHAGPGELYPPVLFVYFTYEVMKLLDKKDGLTPANYTDLIQREEQMRDAISTGNERLRARRRDQ
jgi:hypothetical protein